MLFLIPVLISFFIVMLLKLYNQRKKQFQLEKNGLIVTQKNLSETEKELTGKSVQFEQKISELFNFYDTTRLVSPLFERDKLINIFVQQLSSLEGIEKTGISKSLVRGCRNFKISEDEGYLFLCSRSLGLLRIGPIFAKLLSVCFEKIKLYQRLQELSIHDYLTKTYNRRHFEQRLSEEFLRAQNLNHNLSFLMLDIDNFKAVNDTYGHLVGDAILKKCSLIIEESIRQIDFIGRLGGEEFGVILLDTDKAGAIMVSERICSKISCEKIKVFDEQINVTVSIGVATYPSNTIRMDLLTEIADKALFRAKSCGKDRVCWF